MKLIQLLLKTTSSCPYSPVSLEMGKRSKSLVQHANFIYAMSKDQSFWLTHSLPVYQTPR